MKPGEAISRLKGTLQRSLFPKPEECRQAPPTEKEQHHVKVLEMVRDERHVPVSASAQGMGRKVLERETIVRSITARMIDAFPLVSVC